MDDIQMYNMAINELKQNIIQGPSGTYHVKNGMIYYGYAVVDVKGFSTSAHAWNILH